MRHLAALLCAAALLTLGACDRDRVAHPDPSTALDAALAARKATPASPVVARVNGAPITAEDVRLYRMERPTLTPAQATDALIERELLASHARALPDTRRSAESLLLARKRGLMRAWIDAEVEAKATLEPIDADKLKEAVTGYAAQRGTPEGARASHLLVVVPKNGPDGKPLSEDAREALFTKLKPHAERAAEALGALGRPLTAADLVTYATRTPAPEGSDGWRVDLHMSFPLKPQGTAPAGWITVVPEFREGAAALAAQGRLNLPSAPTRTGFGWHIITLEAHLPAAPISEATARAEIRAERLHHARLKRFKEAEAALLARTPTLTFPNEIVEQKRTF